MPTTDPFLLFHGFNGPSEADVLTPVQYGLDATELTGTLVSSSVSPEPSVLGDAFIEFYGGYYPEPSNVEYKVVFGTNSQTGTLGGPAIMKRLIDKGEVEVGKALDFNFTTNDRMTRSPSDGDGPPVITNVFKTSAGVSKAALIPADVASLGLSVVSSEDAGGNALVGEWSVLQTPAGVTFAETLFGDEEHIEVEIQHFIDGRENISGFEQIYKEEIDFADIAFDFMT